MGSIGSTGGGTAHKNIEAPWNINKTMPEGGILVTSHEPLETPNP